jgi:SAM-dependent methyltransferase
MSRDRLDEHRRVWAGKPVLAQVYGVWFEALLSELPPGRALEVGAGPGFLREYARQRRPDIAWIAVDVIPAPWNDLAADALGLPLRAGTVGSVVGLDLVHHLASPRRFFQEAARVLRPGGHIAVVEPWVTPLSFPIYRWLHEEGCTLGLNPWDPFHLKEGETKVAFQGDAAVVRRLLVTTTPQEWQSLGFRPPRRRILNGFAYLLSLGFKRGSLLPPRATPFFLRLDERLRAAAPLFGMRALVVWERAAP